ncbi:hypothetical protein OSCI_90022 [Kamptonema sp. PCC 6506]|nr:hypothetical protein OSCI_90022 [Kamptonema sp. PCC 6506]
MCRCFPTLGLWLHHAKAVVTFLSHSNSGNYTVRCSTCHLIYLLRSI